MKGKRTISATVVSSMILVNAPPIRAESDYSWQCVNTVVGTSWDKATLLQNSCTSEIIKIYPRFVETKSRPDVARVILSAARNRVDIYGIKTPAEVDLLTAAPEVKAQMKMQLRAGAKLIVTTGVPIYYGSNDGSGWSGTPSIALGGAMQGMALGTNSQPEAPNNLANKVTELGIGLAAAGKDIASNATTNVGKTIGLALGALGLAIAAFGLTMKAIIMSSPRGPAPTDQDDGLGNIPGTPPAVDDTDDSTAVPSAECCATDDSNGGDAGAGGGGVGIGDGAGVGSGGESGGGGDGASIIHGDDSFTGRTASNGRVPAYA